MSPDNAHEFCYKSSCLSDNGLAEITFLVQVVGINGAIRDESAILDVQPLDGISPPREVTLCEIEDRDAPCDGSIAIQLSKTLRLAFKYPESLSRQQDGQEHLLPTSIVCEFWTNASSFADGFAFSKIFPYEAGLRPSQAAFVRLYIPVAHELIGVDLSVRIRMPNVVGPGYFGMSGRRVAALQPPSESSIIRLKPAVHPSDGQALLLQIRRPVDLGDGGRGTALALVFQIYISNSDEESFESGSAPLYTFMHANPSAHVTNVTLSVSNFDAEDRTRAAAILTKRSTAFVWVRASNQRNDNPELSSNISRSSAVLLASTPGPVLAYFRMIADLTASLFWEPPEDKGIGVSYDYPILSYQYAEVEPDTMIVNNIVTVDNMNGDVNSVQIFPLQKGRTYFYTVRPVNDVGAGPWSQHVDCAPYQLFHRPSTCGVVALSIPIAPVVQTLEQGDGFLKAVWRYPSDPGTRPSHLNISLTYKLEFEDLRNGTFINISSDGVTTATFHESLGQVQVGLYYRFRCMALNQVGSSVWSPWSSPTVMLSRPSMPTSLFASAAGPIGLKVKFRLSFQAPLDTGVGGQSWPIVLYEITVTPQSAEFNPNGDACSTPDVATVNGTTTVTIVNDLTAGCDYEFGTRAKNLIGFGPSAQWSFKVQVGQVPFSWQLIRS